MPANNERQMRGFTAGRPDTAFPVAAAEDGPAPTFHEIIADFGHVVAILLALALVTNVIVIALSVV